MYIQYTTMVKQSFFQALNMNSSASLNTTFALKIRISQLSFKFPGTCNKYAQSLCRLDSNLQGHHFKGVF